MLLVGITQIELLAGLPLEICSLPGLHSLWEHVTQMELHPLMISCPLDSAAECRPFP